MGEPPAVGLRGEQASSIRLSVRSDVPTEARMTFDLEDSEKDPVRQVSPPLLDRSQQGGEDRMRTQAMALSDEPNDEAAV